MREWCSCGAAIRAPKHTVLQWRNDHRHTSGEPEPEPDKQGAISNVETKWQEPHESQFPTVQARIGFTRTPPEPPH